MISGDRSRPVGEDDVVFGKTLFDSRGRGDNEDRERAEVKIKNWTVLGFKCIQSMVQRFVDEMEVADDGKSGGRWRQTLVSAQ